MLRMSRNRLLAGILFGCAGFAVNYFKLDLFYDFSLLFGSCLTLFAYLRYGTRTGFVATLIASSCTWLHWNHPWALLINVLEFASIVLLCNRRNWNLISGAVIYWCTVGPLLVWLTYGGIMGFSGAAVLVVALKQGVNAVGNAVAALSFFYLLQIVLKREADPPTLKRLFLAAMQLLILIPAMALLVLDIRAHLAENMRELQVKVERAASLSALTFSTWLHDEERQIRVLASLAGSSGRSLEQNQQMVERMKRESPEYVMLGLFDRTNIIRAASPLQDEAGQQTRGVNLSNQPFTGQLGGSGTPCVYAMTMSKVSPSLRRLVLAVPLRQGGEYRGAAFGLLSLEHVEGILRQLAHNRPVQLTLVDRQRRVIASTNRQIATMQPYEVAGGGRMKPLSSKLRLWVPDSVPKVGAMKRWSRSFMQIEQDISGHSGWKLIVEMSLEPMLRVTQYQANQRLVVIAAVILVTVLLSRMFSNWLTKGVKDLAEVTADLPDKVYHGTAIEWPRPIVQEAVELLANYRQTTDALQRSFAQLQAVNEQLEDRVAERTRELSESEARWQFALDGAGDGVWDWDLVSNKVYYSRQWKAIQGYAEDEIGDSLSEFSSRIHPDDKDSVFEQLERYWRGEAEQFRPEFRFRHKDGSYTYIMGRGIVTHWSAEGKPLRMIGTHTDLTDRRLLEEALCNSSRTAEAANLAKSAFLANMSHEIRTPLNAVVGFTQLLEDLELSDEAACYLKSVKTASDSLLSLINDILDLSRIEAGGIQLEQRDFMLHQSVTQVVLMLKPRAYEKKLHLQARIADGVPSLVVGDEVRFKQVLLNLIGNAVKFTEFGSVVVDLRCVGQTEDQYRIQVQVIDSGIGMDEEAIGRLFNPFEQADGSITRKYGGTGLGLAISKRLCEEMGGSLEVVSTPGVGSTFTLQIPFGISHAEPGDLAPADLNIPISRLWQGQALDILFVEDSELNLQLTTSMLTKMGHRVTEATDGAQAISLLNQCSFDLVLLDIDLPKQNGYEVCRHIRQHESGWKRHLPVVAITANALRGDKERILSRGFDGYLAKPFRFVDLATIMQEAVGCTGALAEKDEGTGHGA